MCPAVIFLRSSGMRNRQLPVKSSLPAKSTMVSPMGNMVAEASFPPSAPPIEAATPAKAMNTPASAPKSSIRGRLCAVLFSAAAQ